MFRSLRAALAVDRTVRAVMYTFVSIVLVGLSMGVLVWRNQTLANTTAVAVLTVKIDGEIARRKVMEESWRAELDAINVTLYASEPTPTRKPSVLEAWQIQRDNELRATIKRLERVVFSQQQRGEVKP